ncbi:formate dehydrogenase subunit delta [Nocardia crassostreae]|uniref:formate dehydrogenase subunit delta n=1 Tax=Nocardia crassostreae TaxID=53428 RepID=UPI00082D8175|nr:formate dehydrogenase subunit delta [Nocardia crassostreae]
MTPITVTELRAINRIAIQFGHVPAGQAALAVADHITRFWDRRMIVKLLRAVDDDPTGLDPVVAGAVDTLRDRAAARARADTARGQAS